MPRLSIILPVHYRPKWAPFAFGRLADQHPVEGWDLEVLAIGRSDDPTLKMAEEYGFKTYEVDRDECGYKLNYGLSKVTGDWVGYATDDDLHSRNRIKQAAIAHSAGAYVAVGYQWRFGWPKKGILATWKTKDNPFTSGSGVTIRTEMARKAGGWSDGHTGFDHAFFENLKANAQEVFSSVYEMPDNFFMDAVVMSHEGNLSRMRELIQSGIASGRWQRKFEVGEPYSYEEAEDPDYAKICRLYQVGGSPDVGAGRNKRFSWVVPTYYRPKLVRMCVSAIEKMAIPSGWEKEIILVASKDDPAWKDGVLYQYLIEHPLSAVGSKIHRGYLASSGDIIGICGDDDFLSPSHMAEAIAGGPLCILDGFRNVDVEGRTVSHWKSHAEWPPVGSGMSVSRDLVREAGGWPQVPKCVDHKFRERVRGVWNGTPTKLPGKFSFFLSAPNSLSKRASFEGDHDKVVGPWCIEKPQPWKRFQDIPADVCRVLRDPDSFYPPRPEGE